MKKTLALQTFNIELQKLSNLINQQHQFNNRYILKALQSVASSTSLPQSSSLSVNNNNDQDYYQNVQAQYDSNNLYTGYENIQEMNQQLHDDVQFQNVQMKEMRKIMELQLRKQPQRINLASQQVDLDEQTTTKSINYQAESQQNNIHFNKYYQQNNDMLLNYSSINAERQKQKYIKQIEDQDDKPTIINGHERIKNKINKLNKNNIRINEKAGFHGQSNYYDSAAATQTIQMSFDRNAFQFQRIKRQKTCNSKSGTHTNKPSDPTINMNKKETGQKVRQVKKKQKQVRRPLTSLKITNKNVVPGKINHINHQQLQKLKQKGMHEQTQQKRLTNRKNKTKRQPITHLNKNQSVTTLQGKNYSNLNSKPKPMKKRQSNQQQHSHATNTSNKIVPHKAWYKSTQKSVKKLNRMNIVKIHDNTKKEKQIIPSNCISSVPHQNENQYFTTTQTTNYSKSIINSRYIPNSNSHSIPKNNHIANNSNFEQSPQQISIAIPQKNLQFFENINLNKHINYQNVIKKQSRQKKNQQFVIKKQEKIGIVQKLDFDIKTPIMQRIIETKNIFKVYNQMSNSYIQAARKINTKELKNLQIQIKQVTQQAILKMKVITAIVAFFSQFFKPTKKNVMGLIARYQQKQQNLSLYSAWNDDQQINIKDQNFLFYHHQQQQSNTSQDTLILSLLQKPRQLINKIQTLPSHLYNCNILSQFSVQNLLSTYNTINEKIDNNGDLQLFLIKKSKIFQYFHVLVQFIKYLYNQGLIERTERRNLNINKNMMMGYYSSRSRREERIKNNVDLGVIKIKKGCDSERKMTVNGIETDRIYDIQKKFKQMNQNRKYNDKNKNKKQGKYKSMQKQSKMSLSRQAQNIK